jgi:xylulokinase
MSAEVVIGVDLGTTALKGGLFDISGNALAVAESAYPIARPQHGWAEQEPAWWMAALEEVLSQLQLQVPRARAAAIGVCSQVNTHVFVDGNGVPLRPAIIWQDQRCAAIAEEMNARLAAKAPAKGERFNFAASSLVSRAGWLAQEEPELWARTRYILSPKDYATATLCALRSAVTDPITPFDLVDPTGIYDDDVVALLDGLAERLPLIERFDTPIGIVASQGFPLIEDATVVTGTMDAWGSVYGSGVIEHGDAMEVAGTSEILGVLSREQHPTPGVVSFLAVDGHHLHAGPTQAGGAALAWFAGVHGRSIADVLDAASHAQPGSGGLIFLPHLLGERAPLWDSDVRGAFIGLSSDSSFAELSLAVLEGVAYSARHLLEEIDQAAGFEARSLAASGGGSVSDLWCQIKADVLGRPIERMRVRHSGCLGAALMAASGARLVDGLREASTEAVWVEQVFEPRSGREVYDELYALYRELYLALKPTHAVLAGMRRPADLAASR